MQTVVDDDAGGCIRVMVISRQKNGLNLLLNIIYCSENIFKGLTYLISVQYSVYKLCGSTIRSISYLVTK